MNNVGSMGLDEILEYANKNPIDSLYAMMQTLREVEPDVKDSVKGNINATRRSRNKLHDLRVMIQITRIVLLCIISKEKIGDNPMWKRIIRDAEKKKVNQEKAIAKKLKMLEETKRKNTEENNKKKK